MPGTEKLPVASFGWRSEPAPVTVWAGKCAGRAGTRAGAPGRRHGRVGLEAVCTVRATVLGGRRSLPPHPLPPRLAGREHPFQVSWGGPGNAVSGGLLWLAFLRLLNETDNENNS